MQEHPERIQKLEIEQAMIKNDILEVKETLNKIRGTQDSIKSTIDSWNGGLDFFTKGVFVVASAVGLFIALSNYISG